MNSLTMNIPSDTPKHVIKNAHLRAAIRLAVLTVEQWLHPAPRRTADDIAFEQLLANQRPSIH
jgi:hypothetical protein